MDRLKTINKRKKKEKQKRESGLSQYLILLSLRLTGLGKYWYVTAVFLFCQKQTSYDFMTTFRKLSEK